MRSEFEFFLKLCSHSGPHLSGGGGGKVGRSCVEGGGAVGGGGGQTSSIWGARSTHSGEDKVSQPFNISLS